MYVSKRNVTIIMTKKKNQKELDLEVYTGQWTSNMMNMIVQFNKIWFKIADEL